MKKIIINAILGAMIASSFTSCKKWLDVNTDPNNLSLDKADMALILPSAEYAVAYVVGNKYQEIGGFSSQYWTQLPSATQYYDYDRYNYDAADANREWGQMYSIALKDLQIIEKKATELKDSNYNAVAKLLSAYIYHVQTDLHGDIPMSEALRADDGILNPKYDAQSKVYEQILTKINDGLAQATNGQVNRLASSDVMFGGDMGLWTKFGNSLKLKVLMRAVDANPAYATQIAALAGADFLLPGDGSHAAENAKINFVDKQGNKNPLYASIAGLGVNNNIASATIGDTLNSYEDPRASYFFDLNTAGLVVGTKQGIAAAGVGYPANSPRSNVAGTIIGATVPVYLMTGHEVSFLLAEAKARSLMPGADAETDYTNAVVGSMTECGVDTAGLDLFSKDAYKWETSLPEQLRKIGVQKWISFCGTQNLEAWFEQRRMDWPKLTPSQASVLPTGKLHTRIPYPNSEETGNSNFPGQQDITKKMWWDL